MKNMIYALLVLSLAAFVAIGCNSESDSDSDDDDAPVADDDLNDDTGDDDQTDDDVDDDVNDDVDDDLNDDLNDDVNDDADDDIEHSCNATEIVRKPYLLDVTQSTIRIHWGTNLLGDSIVEYGLTEALGNRVDCNQWGMIHRCEVPDLETETQYYYRVESCGLQSAIYRFQSAPHRDTPFTVGVWGDNRSDPASHQMVADAMADAAPDIAINVGDIVGDGWVASQYDEQYFDPAAALLPNTPTYISIGNHESESVYYYSLFTYPGVSGYYSFTYGNTLFIALNTNRLYIHGSPQYQWFKQTLESQAATDAEWIVVFAHHPAWSEGWDSPGYQGEILMRITLVPLFEQYGVDLFFCGHTHDYERGEKNGVTHMISGGGGSALDSFQQDFDFIEVYETRYHFVNLTFVGDTLSIEAIDPDGTVFDEHLLTH